MFRLVLLALLSVVALRPADALSGTGEGGRTWSVLPGYHTSLCQAGTTCQGARFEMPSVQRCAIACANQPTCRCAIYRPRDGFCSLKRTNCVATVTGLRDDPTNTHQAIVVRDKNNPVPTPGGGSGGSGNRRCGASWDDANRNCRGACPGNTSEQCKNGLKCWSNLSMAPCAGGGGPNPSPKPGPKPAPHPPAIIGWGPTRCGASWDDANRNCRGACPSGSSSQCKNGLTCWRNLSLAPCGGAGGGGGGGGGPGPAPIPRDGPGTGVGPLYRSMMTNFDGFGYPYGGCGVPMSDMVDSDGKALPFVALNRFSGWGTTIGRFAEGNNCGRWVKISVKAPCGSPNDGSNWNSCLANWGSGAPDGNTGRVVYGYVADSCADTNNWCRDDVNHIDMSSGYLKSLGMHDDWRNNRIEWQFLDSAPAGWSQRNLRFRWCADAATHWLCFIVANTDNGSPKVQVKLANGGWVDCQPSYILGNQWIMPQAWGNSAAALYLNGGKYIVRPYDVTGRAYGEFALNQPSGSDQVTNAQ